MLHAICVPCLPFRGTHASAFTKASWHAAGYCMDGLPDILLERKPRCKTSKLRRGWAVSAGDAMRHCPRQLAAGPANANTLALPSKRPAILPAVGVETPLHCRQHRRRLSHLFTSLWLKSCAGLWLGKWPHVPAAAGVGCCSLRQSLLAAPPRHLQGHLGIQTYVKNPPARRWQGIWGSQPALGRVCTGAQQLR